MKFLNLFIILNILVVTEGFSKELLNCTSISDPNVIDDDVIQLSLNVDEKKQYTLNISSSDAWSSYKVSMWVNPKTIKNEFNLKTIRFISAFTFFGSNQTEKNQLTGAQSALTIQLVRPSDYLKYPVSLVKEKMSASFQINQIFAFDDTRFIKTEKNVNCTVSSEGQSVLKSIL